MNSPQTHIFSKPPERILVVCTQRIGDVLLTTPLIKSLRTAWPHAKIDFLGFEVTLDILRGNPDIDQLIPVAYRESRSLQLQRIRGLWRSYDIALTPMATDRARLYCWIAGKWRAALFNPWLKEQPKRWFFHVNERFDDVQTHTVSMGLLLTDRMGIAPVWQVVPPQANEQAIAELTQKSLAIQNKKYAVLHPSPRFPYKSWTKEGWLALIDWLLSQQITVVLSGGADVKELAYCSNLVAAVQVKNQLDLENLKVLNLVNQLSFSQIATLLRGACIYVGPDTVTTHLAAACAVPTVALFGPSNPVKWGPWPANWQGPDSPWMMKGSQHKGNVYLLQGSGECVPCRQEGCDRHQQSRADCLIGLDSKEVIEAVQALWDHKQNDR